MVQKVVVFAILGLFMPVVMEGCGLLTPAPVRHLKSYSELRKDYAAEIQNQWRADRQYTIVPLSPFEEPYKPGTILEKDSAQPLTDACVVPDELVKEVQISTVPISWDRQYLDINFGLPEIVTRAMGSIAELRTAVTRTRQALFGYSEIRIINIRTDILKQVSDMPKCRAEIEGKEVVIVRGLVKGKELISNGLVAGGQVKTTLIEKAIEVKYDGQEGYEVSDATPQPRFLIVAGWYVEPAQSKKGTPQGSASAIVEQPLSKSAIVALDSPAKWVDRTSSAPLPEGAIRGGDYFFAGVRGPVYVCRAGHNGSLHPGKLFLHSTEGWICNIGWGGKEVVKSVFQVAVAKGHWGKGETSKALKGGDEGGVELYVCRVNLINWGWHTGKMFSNHCNVGWGGKELVIDDYELFFPA